MNAQREMNAGHILICTKTLAPETCIRWITDGPENAYMQGRVKKRESWIRDEKDKRRGKIGSWH